MLGHSRSALALFRWQALHNPVYAEFVAALGMEPRDVLTLEAIPFLPVEMFKSHEIKSGHWQTARVFRSSGTQPPRRGAAFHGFVRS